MKLTLLAAGIEQKERMQAEARIPEAQVAAYYAKHHQQFIVPEEREFMIILDVRRGKVLKAKREIESGAPFLSVARRFSEDPEAPNGVQSLTRYEQEPRLVKHVFAAQLHRLTGPIAQAADFYIFELTKITPERGRSLADVEKSIRHTLAVRKLHGVATAFARARASAWKERTTCAVGYVVSLCRI